MIGSSPPSISYRVQSLMRDLKLERVNASEKKHQQSQDEKQDERKDQREQKQSTQISKEQFQAALESLRKSLEAKGLSIQDTSDQMGSISITDKSGKVLQTLTPWEVMRQGLQSISKGSLLDKSY